MSAKTGIWIDKKHAYIVTLENGDPRVEILESEADFRVRFEGEVPPVSRFGTQFLNKEKVKDAQLEKQLKDYYKAILQKITDTGELYIFGPAEAKNEFYKLLSEYNEGLSKVTEVDTADKLTENQVVAAVKKHFENSH
ncbi:hypothetical protein [Abyssalbus ytuae]|uniref:Uncharacterized protein n=1 Tax=Abyssalbus ytuae TaxID=2926907 RepID=A0A9E6ZTC7_9FLAO|nr:hypothetical protein [Abyssalbus ytuae]UOB16336.1 hypothetical protein MQE35_11365 [Abyssalbus ytuae]